MEFEGLKSRIVTTADGKQVSEYWRKTNQGRGVLTLTVDTVKGNFTVQYLEGGKTPGVVPGERVSSPSVTETLMRRCVVSMAIVHLGAAWLADGYSEVDIEMVKRGYEIGALVSGHLIWFRREHGATIIVKREESDQLPSTPLDPTHLVIIGLSGKELVVKAMDYRSLVLFIESDAHYEIYQPFHDVLIPGLYSPKLNTVH